MRKRRRVDRRCRRASSGISRREFLSRAAAGGAVTFSLMNNSCIKTNDDLLSASPATSPETTPVIDVHRHAQFQPASTFEEMIQEFAYQRLDRKDIGSISTTTLHGITAQVYPEVLDIHLQVQGQREAGVTMGLLSFSMGLEMFCWALFFLADDLATQQYNDGHAAMVAEYPEDLAFMAMVNPFRSRSVAECERCHTQLGAKGISIGTSWDGEFLDSPALEPLWEYAQDREQPVWLHPPYAPIGHEKMALFKLEEIVGRPFDTTMSITRMIYSGVFDRYPGLKVVLPHMGGGLPNIIGRLDFGYRLGYEGLPSGEEATCERMPSEYLRTNLYVDTMGFSSAGIRHCIDLFGADRVLFGSDYPPVPISPGEHINIVRSLDLAKEDEEKILWKNANELFDLGLSTEAS